MKVATPARAEIAFRGASADSSTDAQRLTSPNRTRPTEILNFARPCRRRSQLHRTLPCPLALSRGRRRQRDDDPIPEAWIDDVRLHDDLLWVAPTAEAEVVTTRPEGQLLLGNLPDEPEPFPILGVQDRYGWIDKSAPLDSPRPGPGGEPVITELEQGTNNAWIDAASLPDGITSYLARTFRCSG